MHGGLQAGALLDDTWEWDGVNWVQMLPIGAIPGPRYQHAIGFDTIRGTTILFGGIAPDAGARADTWEWDGDRWHRLSPVTSPSGRAWFGMATDPARGRIVLYGGTSPSSSFLFDTWEWDCLTANWVQRTPSTVFGERYGYGITFDEARGSTVLFGGWRTGSPTNETYELSATTPASFLPFGPGCAGVAGVPTLRSLPGFGPFAGGTLVVDVVRAPLKTLGTMVLGLSRTVSGGIPLPIDLGVIGMPGCTLFISSEVLSTLTSPVWSLPMPSAQIGLGRSLYLQAALIDPAANALGVVISDSFEMKIGTR